MVVFRRLPEENGGQISDDEGKDELLQQSVAKWQLIDATQSSIRIIQIPILSNVSSSAVRRTTDETVLRQMLSSDPNPNVFHVCDERLMCNHDCRSNIHTEV